MSDVQDKVDAKLEDLIDKPKTIMSDGMQVTEQSVDEMIKLDRYLASKSARSSVYMGLRFGVMRPPEH
jgi:hypothetical protein